MYKFRYIYSYFKEIYAEVRGTYHIYNVFKRCSQNMCVCRLKRENERDKILTIVNLGERYTCVPYTILSALFKFENLKKLGKNIFFIMIYLRVTVGPQI